MNPWLYYGEWVRIPTYFTMLMLGFAAASVVLRREALREGLAPRLIMDAAALAVPAVLIGARLAHVILVDPQFYLRSPREILNIAYGGFVFYGGLASAGALLFAWSRRTGISMWRLGDVFAPATAFGLMFGRLGCLGSGCCYGKPADWPFGVQVPWSIQYWRRGHLPEELLAMPLHPSPLYEIALAWLLFIVLSLWRGRQRTTGEAMLGFIALYGVGRSILEIFRADTSRGIYFELLSTSQIIGLISATIAVGLLLWRRHQARTSAPS